MVGIEATESALRARRAIFPPEQEQERVEAFFARHKPGYFVDVGAADPSFGSQTWHFEQAGWTGVLIEPRPGLARALRERRRAQVFEFACSSPANAGRTMPMRLRGGYSTLNETLVIRGLQPQGMIDVRIRTLDDILSEAGAPPSIDFVSVDVEGHEIEVLDGFDLKRWRPRLLLIEDHVLNLRLHQTLLGRGYKWVGRTGLNGWYVPADAPLKVGWFGWLQFVRKYHLNRPIRHVRDSVRGVRAALGVLPPSRGR